MAEQPITMTGRRIAQGKPWWDDAVRDVVDVENEAREGWFSGDAVDAATDAARLDGYDEGGSDAMADIRTTIKKRGYGWTAAEAPVAFSGPKEFTDWLLEGLD